MANVIIKPLARTETPDGPLYATEIDGCIVHGREPVTVETRAALSEIVAAAKRYIAKNKPFSR